ncbi:MAG: Arc family DNA-binding protein [Phycisphaerae bacterium]
MSSKRKAILLRIPEDLWDELNRWARDELRSVNAQLEYVLREAVRRREQRDDANGRGPPVAKAPTAGRGAEAEPRPSEASPGPIHENEL